MAYTVDQHMEQVSLDSVDKTLVTRSLCAHRKATPTLSPPKQVSGQHQSVNPAEKPNGEAVPIHCHSTTGKKKLGKKEEERIDEAIKTLDSSQDSDLVNRLVVYRDVNNHFRRRRQGAIVYVQDSAWEKYQMWTVNCHLFVGTESPPPDSMEDGSVIPGHGPARTSTVLPSRVKIVNEPLLDELKRVLPATWLQRTHVSPFRSLIPDAQAIRDLLKEKQEEFDRLSQQSPDDPAVKRTFAWLPLNRDRVDQESRKLSTRSDGSFCLPSDDYEEMTMSAVDKARMLLDGLSALVDFIDNDLASLLRTHQEGPRGGLGKVPFSHLWHLFHPGQEIITKQPNKQVYLVIQVTGGRKAWEPRQDSIYTPHTVISSLAIDCFSLDYDGQHVQPVPKTIFIKPYDGELPVTALSAYPFAYDDSTSRDRLIQRGEKFAQVARVSHQRYEGLSLTEGEFDTPEEIDSNIMIDFELAYRSKENWIGMSEFGRGVIASPTKEDQEENIWDDVAWYDFEKLQEQHCTEFIQSTPFLESRPLDKLGDTHFLLLSYRVYGYALLNRKWYPLDIDKVTAISQPGDRDAFHDLVLPDDHKRIVQALVKTHRKNPNAAAAEFDLVKGKGKGLIILLHGPPGVGKTSTAECVAAHTGRPLFPITCGDLGGNNAQEVENNLERFFYLARKWGCVLLLDEADVFLSERMPGNIVQNSLVSVFLRILEYYSGILILTTNRVGQFDEAALSRIHCALLYTNLDQADTLEVWKKNIQKLKLLSKNRKPTIKYDKDRIKLFAKQQWARGLRWNGRQIKNAFQTAVALAEWDAMEKSPGKEPAVAELTTHHFELVINTSKNFERYIESTRSAEGVRARVNNWRNDSFQHGAVPESRQQPVRKSWSSYIAAASQEPHATKRNARKQSKSRRSKGIQESDHTPISSNHSAGSDMSDSSSGSGSDSNSNSGSGSGSDSDD